jgi:ascorbate-specific PTS system EIIC-type component UlaA
MATERSRRTTLALLLALLAAVGMGLVAAGLSRLVDSAPLAGVVLLALGAGFVGSAFRWLRSINARAGSAGD